ncbi:MAG: hypothetical protein AB4080_07135 [Trichodesmium sp.]
MENCGELRYLIDAISVYNLQRSKSQKQQRINLSEETTNNQIMDKYIHFFSSNYENIDEIDASNTTN